jgi:ATP-binding cassette, subfamily F, member 3
VLSGGERGRYALLRLLLHPANFLLLDEPTNHLDMRAKDVLLEALAAYSGTVVLVSHDRYFIDKLATRVFEVGGGRVEVYPGNYEDYLWRKQGRNAHVPTLADVPGRESPRKESSMAASGHAATPTESGNGDQGPSHVSVDESKGKRLNPIRRKQMEDRLKELEEEIARSESAIARCETALLTFVSAQETQKQNRELAALRDEVANLMSEWEQVSQTLQLANSADAK